MKKKTKAAGEEKEEEAASAILVLVESWRELEISCRLIDALMMDDPAFYMAPVRQTANENS